MRYSAILCAVFLVSCCVVRCATTSCVLSRRRMAISCRLEGMLSVCVYPSDGVPDGSVRAAADGEARGARITTTAADAAAAIDHLPGRRVMSPAIRGRTDNSRHYRQFYHRGCCCLPLLKIPDKKTYIYPKNFISNIDRVCYGPPSPDFYDFYYDFQTF